MYQLSGLIILALIISVIKLIKRDSKGFYKQFITLLLIGLLTFLFTGNTSAGKNLKITPLFFNNKTSTSQAVKNDKKSNKENITADTTALLSGRDNFLKNNVKKYKESSIMDKAFGIGYIAPKKDVVQERKLVEIDYFDIFFCHGILGTLIYIIPLAVIILISIKKFFTKFINNIKNNMLIFTLYSIAIGFGIALMAGHVFTAPAVSMFLILIILEMLSILKFEKDLKNE